MVRELKITEIVADGEGTGAAAYRWAMYAKKIEARAEIAEARVAVLESVVVGLEEEVDWWRKVHPDETPTLRDLCIEPDQSGGNSDCFKPGQRVVFEHNGSGPLYGRVAIRDGLLAVVDRFGDWAWLDALTNLRSSDEVPDQSGEGESNG